MADLVETFRSAANSPQVVLLRLFLALAAGMGVSWIYRRTRSEPPSSFTTTLVLLAVLIAMVTQIIGDNVARAFSLVGALSIVRFRTAVRDTEDTAYVIFSVAVGMAIGASNLFVGLAGTVVMAISAALTKASSGKAGGRDFGYRLDARVGLGRDAHAVVSPVLDAHVAARQLVEVKAAKVGAGTDVSYRVSFASDDEAHALVSALGRVDGLSNVSLTRELR